MTAAADPPAVRQLPPSRLLTAASVRFLVAATLSAYGDWLTSIALLVLVFRITGSVAAPGACLVAKLAPRIFGATIGGAVADRFRPTRVVVTCALVQAGLILLVAWSTTQSLIIATLAIAAASQLLGAIAEPAFTAMVPRIADPGQLGRLNSLHSTGLASAIFVAPAVGGMLLQVCGPEVLFLLDAASLLLGAALLLTVPLRGVATAGTSHRPILAGIRAVVSHRVVRVGAAGNFAGAMAFTVLQASMVLAAEHRFGGDAAVGVLYAAAGLGALAAGAGVFARGARRIGLALMLSACVVEAAATAAFAACGCVLVGCIIVGLQSLAGSGAAILATTEMQRRTAADVVGRASGALFLSLNSGGLAGAILALLALPRIGWAATLALAAVFEVLLVVVVALPGWSARRATLAHSGQPQQLPVATL